MRIIIFHYHLNPGGVTRIIESQIEAIKKISPEQEIILITGDCSNKEIFTRKGVELIIHPEFNYLTNQTDLDNQFKKISAFLGKCCQPGDILHFHNLNLGKNPLLTLAVSKLAYKGALIINHAHDFSEDRSVNQQFIQDIIVNNFKENLNSVLYPKLSNYQYITLNSFDGRRLQNYGVASNRCHILANPVVFNENELRGSIEDWKQDVCKTLKIDTRKLIITYPVRVIRRKNIGEFILLAALLRNEANWVVTQPPKNPIEIEPYAQWKNFCAKNKINISWEAGTKVDFEKLIRVSDFCISTSIQEGFGMVFMEPWLLNTPVIGRNIPMVTSDMIDEGMQFPLLYDKLLVGENMQLYELPIEEQMNTIYKICTDATFAEAILVQNPFIKTMLNQPDNTLIEQNKAIILSRFSLNNYGSKLDGIYREIIKYTR